MSAYRGMTINDLPNELLESILCPTHLPLSTIALSRTVCRRWADVGGAVLDRKRRMMAAAAVCPGGSCAHQWLAIEALTAALIDDAVPALLRVLDTGIVGPNDPIDTRGWNRLDADATSTGLAHMVENADGKLDFASFVLCGDADFVTTIPPLIVTPLAMAFAYNAFGCARALIDLGAYPMPHADALMSFLIERCAWQHLYVVDVGPRVSSWLRPRAIAKSCRVMRVLPALALLLDAFFGAKPGRRAPLGIVPPLIALVQAVDRVCDIVLHESVPSFGGVSKMTTEEDLAAEAAQLARLLVEAGYDPRAPSRCRGPFEASRMYTGHVVDDLVGAADCRRLLVERMAVETPCDAVKRCIAAASVHGRLKTPALDALLDAFQTCASTRLTTSTESL